MSHHPAHEPIAAGHGHSEVHEGPIRTPKQLAWTVVLSFLVPIAVIVLLVSFVDLGIKTSPGSDGLGPAAVAERIKPVGHVEVKDVTDAASMKTGNQVYAAQCAACHAAGVAGSPKFGDAAAWAPRIGQGYEALLTSALKGKGAMGAQGGGDFSDFEIGRAVVYMVNQGGGKLAEPAMPAASAATADAAPAAAATPAAPAAAASSPAVSAAPSAAPAADTAASQPAAAAK
jgi:cytochrome c5